MSTDHFIEATNEDAPFTLKLHRGESMVLLAMNWRGEAPPQDFVGFAIEYMEPSGKTYWPVKNRLSFLGVDGDVNKEMLSSRFSPIQKFRWVHFPMHAEKAGMFTYRVTPVFMNERDELSYGLSQEASIELGLETYKGELNVAFTRGFVSSQAFVDHYQRTGKMSELLPAKAAGGLDFVPTHPEWQKALNWMGFEARDAVLGVLDEAIADETATVYVVAYDLNVPEVVERLKKLGPRLRVIIDNSKDHNAQGSAENKAEKLLVESAGKNNVTRQKMQSLQHNKTITVDGKTCKAVVCGSTNFSWRGFYVQANNAIVMRGAKPVAHFLGAFEAYWPGDAIAFEASECTKWAPLGLPSIYAEVTFSPHADADGVLEEISTDVKDGCESSVLFSLAFLHQTPGAMREAITELSARPEIFVYGMSDNAVSGIDLDTAKGHFTLTEPEVLGKDAPEPFKSEPSGGSGIRMHHKFIIVDFEKPTARVYLGSYNFSNPADLENGENLLCIRDPRVATAYMVEALRLFDHYEFRVKQTSAEEKLERLFLRKPPREAGESPWWSKYWQDQRRAKDRELFA
jgi:hypothetical protein